MIEDPEPATPDCGIAGPHAPGQHPPALDPGWNEGEDEDTAADDEKPEPAEGRRVRGTTTVRALIVAAALASLGLLLALLV
jgi:hypothetical protein